MENKYPAIREEITVPMVQECEDRGVEHIFYISFAYQKKCPVCGDVWGDEVHMSSHTVLSQGHYSDAAKQCLDHLQEQMDKCTHDNNENEDEN